MRMTKEEYIADLLTDESEFENLFEIILNNDELRSRLLDDLFYACLGEVRNIFYTAGEIYVQQLKDEDGERRYEDQQERDEYERENYNEH